MWGVSFNIRGLDMFPMFTVWEEAGYVTEVDNNWKQGYNWNKFLKR